MNQTLCRWITVAVLAFAFSITALADVSGTPTLPVNTSLSLDTGATSVAAVKGSASGATFDILWNGSTLAPQGKARAASFGVFGADGFGFLSEALMQPFKFIASTTPLPGTVNLIIIVFTNGGNTAKVLVTANSGGSITLQFVTFITPVPTGPTIVAILNNSSRIPAGIPSYGIAPSSLFVVQGSGLADPGDPVLQSSEGSGLQTTLNGASITVVVKGTTTHPALYYTSPTQLAAVLPAATPLGTGTLTVTYKGVTSAPAAIQVVASALGINTYNGSGVATDASTGALLTYTNSGVPGETIILWTTGLGSDPADSDTTYTTSPHPINAALQVYIGAIQLPAANIVYQGASVYPGVDVIGLTLPQGVPTGCWVPLAAVIGGVLNHVVTLPINNGGGACFDAQSGLNGNQLSPASGQTLKTGLVAVIQTNSAAKNGTRTVTNSADAAFEKYTGLFAPSNGLSPGGCIVNSLTPVPPFGITGMDPGTITLTGPNGLAVTLASQFGIKGAFFAILAPGTIPASGGAFTFKGSGGADVGPFTTTITFSNPLLTWTNPSVAATIDRSQGFTITWTGGNPGSYLIITGVSSSVSNSTVTSVGFTCLASVDAGQFTVPSYILSALPAGSGGVNVQNSVPATLSATGLDIGTAAGDITHSEAATFK